MSIVDSVVRFFRAPKPADLGDVLQMASLHDRNDQLNKLLGDLTAMHVRKLAADKSFLIGISPSSKTSKELQVSIEKQKSIYNRVREVINKEYDNNLREVLAIKRRAGG